MNSIAIISILIITSYHLYGQQVYDNDTLDINGYIGVIYDSGYAPEESRNIFPKNRFKPTKDQVKEFENEFLNQYGDAIEKQHILSYEQEMKSYEDASQEDLEWIKSYKADRKKYAKEGVKRLKKEFADYDREYYGYIGLNGMKYLRIEFNPHKEKWVEVPGAGESILYNLPPLVYNLDKHELSFLGWTGENDE